MEIYNDRHLKKARENNWNIMIIITTKMGTSSSTSVYDHITIKTLYNLALFNFSQNISYTDSENKNVHSVI